MQAYGDLTPAERELESALQHLRPAGHSIDRDHLMFAAGMQCARGGRRRWQAISGLLTGLLAATWLLRPAGPAPARLADAAPAPIAEERGWAPPPMPAPVGFVPREIAAQLPPYVRLRNRIVVEGADALPDQRVAFVPVGRDGPPATYPRAFGPDRMMSGG